MNYVETESPPPNPQRGTVDINSNSVKNKFMTNNQEDTTAFKLTIYRL
jgi:hypothetical protein